MAGVGRPCRILVHSVDRVLLDGAVPQADRRDLEAPLDLRREGDVPAVRRPRGIRAIELVPEARRREEFGVRSIAVGNIYLGAPQSGCRERDPPAVRREVGCEFVVPRPTVTRYGADDPSSGALKRSVPSLPLEKTSVRPSGEKAGEEFEPGSTVNRRAVPRVRSRTTTRVPSSSISV